MLNVLFILVALLILCVIVVAHEFGHYLVGRLCGIGVEEFAVGFGPKIVGFKRKNIQYSLRAIPLGGYCKFVGEDENNPAPDAMNNQPVWKRFITVLSGPIMNFVLAYLAVLLFLMLYGVVATAPTVAEIVPDMPAQTAGLMAGDTITSVDGVAIEETEDGFYLMQSMIRAADGAIALTVEREGETIDITLTPTIAEDGNKQIGIILGTYRMKYPIGQAFGASFTMIGNITQAMIDSLKGLFFHGEGLDQTMGPVGIISFMSEEARNGFDSVLNLIVLISLNLGILNLLPLPALDGGRLVFLIIEGIRRKPLKAEYEGWVHAAGFVLLLGLIVVITYQDIVRLVTGG